MAKSSVDGALAAQDEEVWSLIEAEAEGLEREQLTARPSPDTAKALFTVADCFRSSLMGRL